MGQQFEFSCLKCGYRLNSGIGEDWGMMGYQRAHCCLDCGWVFQVFTNLDEASDQRNSTNEDRRPKEQGIVCPQCKGVKTSYWDPERPCPKCGKKMRKGDLVMLWD